MFVQCYNLLRPFYLIFPFYYVHSSRRPLYFPLNFFQMNILWSSIEQLPSPGPKPKNPKPRSLGLTLKSSTPPHNKPQRVRNVQSCLFDQSPLKTLLFAHWFLLFAHSRILWFHFIACKYLTSIKNFGFTLSTVTSCSAGSAVCLWILRICVSK